MGDELVLNTGATLGGGVVRRVLPSGEVETRPAGPSGSTTRVVGVFTPAGGDVDDINLVVLRAEDLGTATNRPSFDRVGIVADPVSTDELLDRVAAAFRAAPWSFRPAWSFDGSAASFHQRTTGALSPDREAPLQHGAPDDPESMARNQQNYGLGRP